MFLFCYFTQTDFSLRHTIQSPFDSSCLTNLRKYFRFPRTVPVRLMPLYNSVSTIDTIVYQLFVYK